MQLASVQFHLINTAVLFLSREGFRRGCLRSQQDAPGGADAVDVPRLLATASLVLPFGVVTAAAVCGLVLRRHGPAAPGDPYPTAVYMQGARFVYRCRYSRRPLPLLPHGLCLSPRLGAAPVPPAEPVSPGASRPRRPPEKTQPLHSRARRRRGAG